MLVFWIEPLSQNLFEPLPLGFDAVLAVANNDAAKGASER